MNKTPPIIGYTNRLSARPGEEIEVKVSSTIEGSYEAKFVRIISADPNPAGIGVIEEEVASDFAGHYPARFQNFQPGSYMIAKLPPGVEIPESFVVSAKIWPTLKYKCNQCIVSLGSQTIGSLFKLGIDITGQPELVIATKECAPAHFTLPVEIDERQWATIWASYSNSSHSLTIGYQSIGTNANFSQTFSVSSSLANEKINAIVVAADIGSQTSQNFNGKIEEPKILIGKEEISGVHTIEDFSMLEVFAHWDFSLDIPTTHVRDMGANKINGELINYPSRAMTSSKWDGSEMAWFHQPDHYAAIHFHEDDIYDFCWETDFTVTIPPFLKSGVYGIKIKQGIYSDTIPLFVPPPKGKATARICYLVPTFTYVIYGNHARPDYHERWLDKISKWDAYPWNPAEYRQYGLSTYNFHTDRSGICHASHSRPLFNLRPGYITFGNSSCSGLRHFQADSHLTLWLEHMGYEFDVITDHELHNEGVSVLSNYDLVVTGSHPEYHTSQTLNALENYRDHGGKLAYLGGNGFYWRIAVHTENPNIIEIRRGEGGIRAWAAEPGEYYNAFDGNYGGLWRRNGRPPQALTGVGFSAQGQFYGSHYRRLDSSYSDSFAWMFKGIDDELLGDIGFSGGGAAGFELDRHDRYLGSPNGTIILASSEDHNSTFVLVPEEQLTHLTTLPGVPKESLIRADMTYFENSAGGAVFSTGSITFCGSLPFNNCNNNISQLLSNVFNHFLSDSKSV